ncbi:MAG: hypothetical protein FRX49_04676 [Trebouxia sp. A1-2]|nr:MAG: hypothetical protein FRX49_04676 [Trebouxia sp. A1-2]
MKAKMSLMLSTMIPGSVGVPTMVYVFPDPVAPYANTVAIAIQADILVFSPSKMFKRTQNNKRSFEPFMTPMYQLQQQLMSLQKDQAYGISQIVRQKREPAEQPCLDDTIVKGPVVGVAIIGLVKDIALLSGRHLDVSGVSDDGQPRLASRCRIHDNDHLQHARTLNSAIPWRFRTDVAAATLLKTKIAQLFCVKDVLTVRVDWETPFFFNTEVNFNVASNSSANS